MRAKVIIFKQFKKRFALMRVRLYLYLSLVVGQILRCDLNIFIYVILR